MQLLHPVRIKSKPDRSCKGIIARHIGIDENGATCTLGRAIDAVREGIAVEKSNERALDAWWYREVLYIRILDSYWILRISHAWKVPARRQQAAAQRRRVIPQHMKMGTARRGSAIATDWNGTIFPYQDC